MKRTIMISLFLGITLALTGFLSCTHVSYTDYRGNVVDKRTAEHYNQGNAYFRKSQYDLAISEYTKSIEIDPKQPNAHNNRGLTYAQKGHYDQAIADYTKAIDLDPKYGDAYHNRGLAYSNKGQYDQAISDFTKAIELDPKHGKAYGGRGVAYCAKGQFDRARSDFNNAKKLDPNLKGVDEAMAQCYASRCTAGYELFKNSKFENSEKGKGEKRKKLEEISADCKKALEIDPKNELAKETADNLAGEKAYGQFLEGMDKADEEFRSLFGVGLFEDKQEKATPSKNEFGGETSEKIYKKGDKGSEDVKKEITYFDGNKKKVKAEYLHTDKFANEKGFDRSISYFDGSGKRTKTEYFYTDEFADEKGFNRAISYFDGSGKRTKTEYFYTDEFADEKKFNKSIAFFDNTGKVTRRELYMGDKLIKKIE
jgi:Tfp pilus assembly protein PilF